MILLAVLWRSSETEELIATLNSQTELSLRYPNAIMDGATTRQFDANGNIEYELISDQIRFFEETEQYSDAYIEYKNPEFMFYAEDQREPITVTSEKGYSFDGGETIELNDKVTLVQPLENGELYQVDTDTLTILPTQQFAETDKPVIITQKIGVTTATGLKANLKQQRIELLSNVRGNYVQ